MAISLRGMQRSMICLLSMEEITSSTAPPRNDDDGGAGDCFATLHSARSDSMFCRFEGASALPLMFPLR